MALNLLCQLGVAAALLVLGVCLGLRQRPRVESPLHVFVRVLCIGLAVIIFLLFVGESTGLGPSLATAFDWVATRAGRLWDAGASLLESGLRTAGRGYQQLWPGYPGIR
jgi:hypothetical protein